MKKRLYNEDGLQTKESEQFSLEIVAAIKPIFVKYLADGYCVRDLAHEAFASVRDIELDYMMKNHYMKLDKEQRGL